MNQDNLQPQEWAKWHIDVFNAAGWPLTPEERTAIKMALTAIAAVQDNVFHGNETEYLEPCLSFLKSLLDLETFIGSSNPSIDKFCSVLRKQGKPLTVEDAQLVRNIVLEKARDGIPDF